MSMVCGSNIYVRHLLPTGPRRVAFGSCSDPLSILLDVDVVGLARYVNQ
jgi:hypothetical protein